VSDWSSDVCSSDLDRLFLRYQVILLRIKLTCSVPKFECEAGPDCCVATSCVEVPTCAARGPDGSLHTSLQFGIEGVLCFRFYFNGLHIVFLHSMQTIHDICDLCFNHKNHGIVSKTCVGAN